MQVICQLQALPTLSPRNNPGTHRLGGYQGSRAHLEILVEKKVPCSNR
jgi:hypothetical protein